MSIIDRIILTLYTCSLGVAAVLIMIVSLNLVPLDEFVAFASRIPGRWEYTVGGAVLFMMSLSSCCGLESWIQQQFDY